MNDNFNQDNNFNPGQPLFSNNNINGQNNVINDNQGLPSVNDVMQFQQSQINDLDMPPETGEIEELNSLASTTNSIATGSSLDPMNLISDEMVNSINNGMNINMDILNSYDNGNINNVSNVPSYNFGTQNDYQNNNIINTEYSKPVDFMNIPSYNSSTQNDYQNNNMTNTEYSKPVDFMNIPSYNFETPINFQNDTITNNNIDMDEKTPTPEEKSTLDDTKEELNQSVTDIKNEESNNDANLEYSIENKTLTDEENYTVENKSLNNKEELYDEPDSLEIMDLDSYEDEKPINDEKEDQHEEDKIDVKEIVNKINSFLDELKLENIDLEKEEFDFEDMYQIVIKLKK